jgi:CheY-like chemotaxis protein
VRILLVEDNVDTVLTMRLLLESYGHEVLVAYDGATALRFINERIDLLCLDIGLPIMSGYEVAQGFRDAGHPALMIAISAYSTPSDIARSRTAGCEYHFAKPVDLDKLEAVIALASKRLRGRIH